MTHYFDPRPTAASDPKLVEVNLPDVAFRYRTDTGVFSHGHLDSGTALLLRCDARPSSGRLLDLGCGAGPIALALALRSPQSEVWAIDVNERARSLCEENADAAGVPLVVADPEAVPGEVRFDEIWSNPPVRIGKASMDVMITTWLSRLTPDGRMVMVISRHLGGDSLHRRLTDQGHRVERIASRAGFRVLEVRSRT